MSQWSGGTGIAKFAGAAPLMTVQLTAIQGAVPSKVVPPAKVVPPSKHHHEGLRVTIGVGQTPTT